MALPNMPCWLTDFVTARAALEHPDPQVVGTIVAMCQAGELKFCNCEIRDFRNNPHVRQHFCDNQNCVCHTNGDIATIVSNIPMRIGQKKHHPNDLSARIIAASAVHFGYGIVSNKMGIFATSVDIGESLNVVSYTLYDFIDAL